MKDKFVYSLLRVISSFIFTGINYVLCALKKNKLISIYYYIELIKINSIKFIYLSKR